MRLAPVDWVIVLLERAGTGLARATLRPHRNLRRGACAERQPVADLDAPAGVPESGTDILGGARRAVPFARMTGGY